MSNILDDECAFDEIEQGLGVDARRRGRTAGRDGEKPFQVGIEKQAHAPVGVGFDLVESAGAKSQQKSVAACGIVADCAEEACLRVVVAAAAKVAVVGAAGRRYGRERAASAPGSRRLAKP